MQGRVGTHTAAACLAAGAAGVVLDAQLLLARESPLSEASRHRLAAFDGSETACLGERLGAAYRVFARPGSTAEELAQELERLGDEELTPEERREAWRQTVRKLAAGSGETELCLLGQDAALARPLAARFVTTAGIVQAITQAAGKNLEVARRLRPLAEGAPWPCATARATRSCRAP